MASFPSLPKSQSKSEPKSGPEKITSTKSRLESLPQELLLQIINDFDHEDIQSFARCCPIIWKTAEKVFEVHKKRRKFYTIQLGRVKDSLRPSPRPITILRNLLMDDGLAIYPKRMIIGPFPVGATSRGEADPLDPPLLPEQKDKIRKSWYEKITSVNHPHSITTLLLSLLPNLRAIELHNCERRNFYSDMAHKIARTTRLNWTTTEPSTEQQKNEEQDKWDPDKPHALSNLVELTIYNDEGAYQDFGKVVFWSWLPSLRLIRGRGLHSFKDRETFTTRGGPEYRSDLTSLEFVDCMVCEEDFKILLKYIKDLTTFKYRYGVPISSEGTRRIARLGGVQWNPRVIVELLSTYASHSLVTLDLTRTGNPQFVRGDWLAGRIFVDSLRRFHLLRKLRADTMIFIESPLENIIAKDTQRHRDVSHEDLVKAIKMTMKTLTDKARFLVDLLPASLEELVLCSTHSDGDWEVEDLLGKATILKAQRVPHLSKIVFEGNPSISGGMIQTWKDVGVQMYWQAPLPIHLNINSLS